MFENGSGIEFVILYEGEKIRFKATLVECVNWIKGEKGKLEVIYVSEDKRYFTNEVYQGGVTKFKIHGIGNIQDKEFFELRYEAILTDDLILMQQLLDAEKQYELDQKLKYDNDQYKRVEKINELPVRYETVLPDFIFFRVKASYNPRYSKSIQGGYVVLKHKHENENKYFTLQDYVMKNGKRRMKEFTSYFGKYIKDDQDPRDVLETLIKQNDELDITIWKIKHSNNY